VHLFYPFNISTFTSPLRKTFSGKQLLHFKAVDDVSFDINQNEIVGLVGESGCGKTTLARTILQLIKPTSGKILLKGKDISAMPPAHLRKARKDLQIVFQDPYGSLNPRISIGEAIMEPMKVHHLYNNKREREEKIISLLEQVQLNPDHFRRYPHQFSGGQRQRICIARALALEPSFLLFDESVSALDVSVQAQVLNLVNELKQALNFTAIFISHDLAVVHYISDRIMVMEKGKIVESGTAEQVYHDPGNEYTKKLIAAIPGKKLSLY
jgi:peptide/nickel transport system ATP-binding protein